MQQGCDTQILLEDIHEVKYLGRGVLVKLHGAKLIFSHKRNNSPRWTSFKQIVRLFPSSFHNPDSPKLKLLPQNHFLFQYLTLVLTNLTHFSKLQLEVLKYSNNQPNSTHLNSRIKIKNINFQAFQDEFHRINHVWRVGEQTQWL